MRILIVNSNIRMIGGVEDYLNSVVPEFHRQGHELAFAHEVDLPKNRERIHLPDGTPSWDVSGLGTQRVLEVMKTWKPDVIYAHGLLDPKFESGFVGIAPSVYFAHNYYGTCVSGLKTFTFPVVRPCNRRFGAACLLYYFPRRCGGRNPITMVRMFRREKERLANFFRYRAVVTHSNHMREEYIRNGLPEEMVHNFVDEILPPDPVRNLISLQPAQAPEEKTARSRLNLLFVGRMESLKGGGTVIEALPAVVARLERPIRLFLAGDGPERGVWEQKATRIQARNSRIKFEFTGWLDKRLLELRYAESDLLVVPSLWPEPFGRIGPEAGLHGVPVAAFAVGGVTDWLVNGVNGFLAPGDPPTVAGLAQAIAKCLENPALHEQLRAGAVRIARQFSIRLHLEALIKVLDPINSGDLGKPVGN